MENATQYQRLRDDTKCSKSNSERLNTNKYNV